MLEPRPASTTPAGSRGAALLLTAAEYARHRRELDELRRARDREIPLLLRNARSYVSSDANEEIAQISDDVAVLETRIARLQDLLDEATIVDVQGPASLVTLGQAVEVEYLRTGSKRTYVVAGSAAAGGPLTVSARSPVGSALMGRACGDVVSVELPDGRIENLRIVSVTAAAPEASAA